MRTTLAAWALGMLAIAGCVPLRARNMDETIATGVPAPACKPNALVYDPRTGCSPYASHIVAAKPLASTIPDPGDKPQPAKTPALPPVISAPATPPAAPSPEPVRPVESPPPVIETAPPPPAQLPEPPAKPAPAVPAPAPMAPRLPERTSEQAPPRTSTPERPTAAHDVNTPPEPEHVPPTPTPEPPPIKPAVSEEPAQSEAEPTQVLTGTVECWRKTARLRYAGLDVEDANGGRVTLIGGPAVDRLRDGQRVRVRGTLIPAADRVSAPKLQVKTLDVLD